jgi:hypothetical protein
VRSQLISVTLLGIWTVSVSRVLSPLRPRAERRG